MTGIRQFCPAAGIENEGDRRRNLRIVAGRCRIDRICFIFGARGGVS
jgi:hypothetical protein